MIREVILNSFASTLSKRDRDRLNSAVRSIIANPKIFLDSRTFNEFQDWLYFNGGSDRALSPLTLRVFSIVADKMGINAVHVYELWENDQLIFYPDVPGRLTPTMYDSLIKLEKRASKLVDAGKKIYLVYDEGFNTIGVTSLFFNKCRGQKPFNLADVKTDIPFFQARHEKKEYVTLKDLRIVYGYDPIPSESKDDGYSTERNTKKLVKLLNPSITNKEYKRQYKVAEEVDLNNTMLQHFKLFKEGLRKVSKVKFANPELIFLTIQATDKRPFNIFIDGDLGKRYLEKAMAVVSLHYEDWEV
ncbi:MAG: hypothetical protein HXN39_04905 [Prevotella histicola]|nr:hypothetical protein [Prevotella histicola]